MRRAVYAASESGASFCWVMAGRRARDSCLSAASGGGSRRSALSGTERRILGRVCALEVERAQQVPGGSFGRSSNPTSSIAEDHDPSYRSSNINSSSNINNNSRSRSSSDNSSSCGGGGGGGGPTSDSRRRRINVNAGKRTDTIAKQKEYVRRVKAAGQRGAWREVPVVLSEMRKDGVSRNVFVYNAAISALARCRRPVEAEALLSVMLDCDDVAPDKISYNSAINAHARCGDLDSARRLLGRMRELGPALGMRPDVITFNSVADAAAKRGDPVAAAEVLAIMAEEGLRPDVITYNACLAACKAKGDLRRAVVLLDLMREDGVDPDQRSYSAVIATAGRCFYFVILRIVYHTRPDVLLFCYLYDIHSSTSRVCCVG